MAHKRQKSPQCAPYISREEKNVFSNKTEPLKTEHPLNYSLAPLYFPKLIQINYHKMLRMKWH